MNMQLEELKKQIGEAERICFFTGAGVSTESGIPDFRSQNGLYRKNLEFSDVISTSFYRNDPVLFWELFKEIFRVKLLHEYEPNSGHDFIAELGQEKTVHVITQNIDGLHQKAGSKNVYEIHGTIKRAHCQKCKNEFGLDFLNKAGLPSCTSCEEVLKPNVVLFGDSIHCFEEAVEVALQSDLFIVMGSSLQVTPINQIPLLVRKLGQIPMIIINKEPTHYDYVFDSQIYLPIGEVVTALRNEK
ncbi:NAD-dependent protein deacylase [Priestia flexa]|uniref:NAD-dependent protein deacylase n=1 Tax=Priestia TaxID=2800373 RepID=UPI00220F9FA1|nr:NAD-dependent protein deacylase [Priestia flexa]MDT2046043.1 NAD-dependent protein deacylase [Priestia flexa]USY53923.1 NAD-dependent protein deacylase [Bacillus sp. 1780r2a1]